MRYYLSTNRVPIASRKEHMLSVILASACRIFDVKPHEVKWEATGRGPLRFFSVRVACMVVAVEYFGMTAPDVGRFFKRDRTSVICAIHQFAGFCKYPPRAYPNYKKLSRRLIRECDPLRTS